MQSIGWWGYLHANGTPQLKRWFGDHEDYRGDCIGNPFVLEIVEPFEAKTRDEAEVILRSRLGLSGKPAPGGPERSSTCRK